MPRLAEIGKKSAAMSVADDALSRLGIGLSYHRAAIISVPDKMSLASITPLFIKSLLSRHNQPRRLKTTPRMKKYA